MANTLGIAMKSIQAARQTDASLKAHLDNVEIGDGFALLSGWVVSATNARIVEPLTIITEGQTYSPIPLEFRPDFQAAGVAEGQAGFMVALPLRLGATLPRMVIMDASGATALLSNSKYNVSRFTPRGSIDHVEAEGIIGWIFDPALMTNPGKAGLSINGGPLQPLTLGFDRSDVPYSFFPHPRRFGFHFDASTLIRAAVRDAMGGARHRRFSFELFSSGVKIADHTETLVLNAPIPTKPAPVRATDQAVAVAAPPPALKVETTAPSLVPSEQPEQPRMLVVSWDMGHNPAGRAYLLADIARRNFNVKLIGPLFEQYGKKLWEPLKGQTAVPIGTFPGGTFKSYLAAVIEQVERNPAEVVYVSKPRLSSLLFGLLMRLRHNATVLVDIDDHELSFYKEDKALTLEQALQAARANPSDAEMPYGNVWTQLCEDLIRLADGITVSNIALQERFGGVIVRHARNEAVFSINDAKRRAVRQEFGLSDKDRAIVFVGTPRPHKGIYRIADALERLDDERLVFVMVGSFTDARTKSHFAKYKKARIKCFENQPWERLPELVGMADAVAILQDPKSKISEYQIPAKLTDAMALGVPILASKVPPFADLLDKNAMIVIDSETHLDHVLSELASTPKAFAAQARRGRTQFLSEFSYSVNAARLQLTVDEATEAKSDQQRRDTTQVLQQLYDFAGVKFPFGDSSPAKAPAIKAGDRARDLVFFWKQNDSEIYGRRSDMLVKYLLKSGKIRRVIHFDRSLTLGELEASIDRSPHAPLHQGNHVYLNSLRRIFRMADRGPVHRRTFLCRNGSIPQTFLGVDLPPRAAYTDFVKETLKECGVDEPPLAWVCPVVFDFPNIHAEVPFERVVVDIIDDQRKWQGKPDYMKKVSQNYADVLKVADLVLANCEPVRTGFADLRDDVVVVPNGTEVFAEDRSWTLPDDLAHLPRPIIGYVGNLRDRIDFELIRQMALRHPEWSIVLVGSAQGALELFTLDNIPNIHLMGVRPYEEALSYIKNFDVAIMPHVNNELSQNMNPLKLYVYFSLGVPVVTTEVANISDIASYVSVANSHKDFIAATEDIVRGKINRIAPAERGKVLEKVSWSARVNDILKRLEI